MLTTMTTTVTPAREVTLCASQIKARGWTDSLIARFLAAPDEIRDNPYSHRAAPMRLYRAERVTGAEMTEAFAEARVAARRSAAGKERAARKREALLAQLRVMPIEVPILAPNDLLNEAIAAYNDWQESLGMRGGAWASWKSDPALLARITVNYIRHELTKYDTHLEEMAGKIGVHDARWVIRERVYAEIARVYPQYADECARQLAERLAKHGRDPLIGDRNCAGE